MGARLRIGWLLLLVFGLMAPCATLAAAPTAVPASPGKLEAEVLAALNIARTDPAAYARTLQTYRGFYHANIVVIPGAPENFQTEEGVKPVDEAIAFLASHPLLTGLERSDLLAAVAADHVADQSVSGAVGHYGADGSTPGQRAVRRGGGKGIAEVIAYGATDAIDVIRQLIIDDGVTDRGHRTLIYLDHVRYAGISCGPHPQFRSMCVIDMADTPDGRTQSAPTRIRMAQRDTGSTR